MPKMKTNRSAAKRFSRTGTGRLKRFKACKRHLLTHKPTKRKRQLRGSTLVNRADVRRIGDLLP